MKCSCGKIASSRACDITRVLEVSQPGFLTVILNNQRIGIAYREMYISRRLFPATTAHITRRIPRFGRFIPCAIYSDEYFKNLSSQDVRTLFILHDIYSNIHPTRCNFTQFIYIWKLLYMFRVLLPPITTPFSHLVVCNICND
jgi:hypothetical protein